MLAIVDSKLRYAPCGSTIGNVACEQVAAAQMRPLARRISPQKPRGLARTHGAGVGVPNTINFILGG